MYKAPHSRHDKNLIEKPSPKKYNKPNEEPNFKFKKKPVRRVNKGYKMSYRYKYYNQNNIVEDEDVEMDESFDSS